MSANPSPDSKEPTLIAEIFYYLKVRKKLWMLPMIIVFLIFGALIVVSQVVPMVSPFIYTLF